VNLIERLPFIQEGMQYDEGNLTLLSSHGGTIALSMEDAKESQVFETSPHNLPLQVNRFIGRERELTSVRGLLATITAAEKATATILATAFILLLFYSLQNCYQKRLSAGNALEWMAGDNRSEK